MAAEPDEIHLARLSESGPFQCGLDNFQIWKGKKKEIGPQLTQGTQVVPAGCTHSSQQSWCNYSLSSHYGSASPQPENPQIHHVSTASRVLCPRLSILPAEIFLVSSTVDMSAKHIARPFPDYIAIFYGSLWSLWPQWYPWAQKTFKVTITFLEGAWAFYSFSHYLASDRRGSDLQANPRSKTAIKDRHVQPVWQSFAGPLGAHLHVTDLDNLKKRK